MSSSPPSGDPSAPGNAPRSRVNAGRGAAIVCLVLAAVIALLPGDPGPEPSSGDPEAETGGPAPPAHAPLAVGDQQLTGRVLDPEGAAIAGASVSALRESVPGDRERAIVAAQDGAFTFSQLPAGRWVIRASASGFGVSAAVRDVPSAEPVTLTLARVGRIAGQVLGVDGAPAAGAEIVLAGSGVWPARAIRAGDDGRFVLDDVPPGIYEVQARSETTAAEPRRGLVVDAGGRAYLTFQLEPGASMIGSIIDAETEHAIAGAEIVVMQDELGVAPRALRSAADGSFRLGGLRGTSQRVTVHAEGYVPVVAREWSPGEAMRVAMEPGAVLSGYVLDARRRPIEGARLEVLGEASGQQPIAMDGPSVAFRAEVFAAHEQAMPASLGALEVTAGAVPAIPLLPAAGMDVVPVAGGVVPAATTPRIGAIASGYLSGSDGSFRIEGVPPGHVQVVAHHAGYAPGSTERVWVAPGRERDGIEITLAPSGRIDGEVVDARGAVMSEVLIEHRSDAEPWPRVTVSDARGRFVLEDVAGAVTLRAMPAGRAPVQIRVDVGPGGRERARIVLPELGRTIAGRTIDERGRPIDRAQVRIESMAPGDLPPRVAFTDDRGRFTIDDAPPGPWRVIADHADYAQGEPIDVDAIPGELSVVMRTGVQVLGSVLDLGRGEGIEGAAIVIESAAVPPVTRNVTSDAEGAFVIPRALPGRYVVRVSATGFAPWSRELEIASSPAGEIELDAIELASGATIEGDVVDALGQVVRGAEIGIEGESLATVRTDAQGHFVLAGVGAGSFVIRAAHPAAGAASRVIQVHASRDPAAIVLRLPRRYQPDDADSERALRRGVAAELADDEGDVRVASVPSGTRAEQAGLREGDLVRAVDGQRVDDAAHASRLLRGADGVTAVLDLEREGASFRLRIPREPW